MSVEYAMSIVGVAVCETDELPKMIDYIVMSGSSLGMDLESLKVIDVAPGATLTVELSKKNGRRLKSASLEFVSSSDLTKYSSPAFFALSSSGDVRLLARREAPRCVVSVSEVTGAPGDQGGYHIKAVITGPFAGDVVENFNPHSPFWINDTAV